MEGGRGNATDSFLSLIGLGHSLIPFAFYLSLAIFSSDMNQTTHLFLFLFVFLRSVGKSVFIASVRGRITK